MVDINVSTKTIKLWKEKLLFWGKQRCLKQDTRNEPQKKSDNMDPLKLKPSVP